MQLSHSRVELFKRNPLEYQLRYIDKLKTLPTDDPTHPLIIGNAMHKGMETTASQGIHDYFMSYPIITDRHIEEAMKLEALIPKAKRMIPDGEHEVMLYNPDFIGFIDLVSKNEDGTYSIYDFKYSNNVDNYRKSSQMHLYKYFWERQNPGKTVSHLYYLFVPKTAIRQKKTESLHQFRERLLDQLSGMKPELLEIEYDSSYVIEFLLDSKKLLEAKTFPLYPDDYLWRFSEYYDYITKGEDYMILPKNERRDISKVDKRTIWQYGKPMSGKTTFANAFPDPLMLNTDGNIQFVDAPFIAIKDTVVTEGRRTVRTLAWENFKNVIAELEKKDNDFKTIIVDLVEDTYESCRLYMYDKLGISHESDDSFRAWDKVRIEFLSTYRKLMNLDYENIILISHEDTSKDITKKGGDRITAIKPNLNDKVANKLAGMVHIVARTIVEENDDRVLSFKQDEVTFGGGRLSTDVTEIPLDFDAFLEVYEEANANKGSKFKGRETKPVEEKPKRGRKVKEESEEGNWEADGGVVEVEAEPDETISAEFLEEVRKIKDVEVVTGESQYDEMSVAELRSLAKEREIRVPRGSDKSSIIDLLVDYDFDKEVFEVESVEELEVIEEEPKQRTRKRKDVEPIEDDSEDESEDEVEEQPKTRTRTRKTRD